MNKMLKAACLLLIFASLFSCKKNISSDSKPVLVVSLEPQRNMLQQLAGNSYEIVTLLPPGSNPETFEPTVAQRMKTANAQAYFPIGYLPFEQAMASDMGQKGNIFDISKGIDLVMGTHSHGEGEHAEADPHIWTSVKNAKVLAANYAAALSQIDPDNSQEYQLRLQQMTARLDSLDYAFSQKLAGAHAFAVWHPSLSYFARDYGLHQISVGQESKEVSINTLKKIIDEAREDSVEVFFFQKEYDARQAENINREIGSRLVTINPLSYDWEEELTKIVDELAK